MFNNRKFWVVVIRIVAILWFLLALMTLVFSLFPWIVASFSSFIQPSLGSFVHGFGSLVGLLWGIAMACLYGLIGWYIWSLNETHRMTIVFLCVLMLAFSIFSIDLIKAVLILITLFVLLFSKSRTAFSPGGGRSGFRIRGSYSNNEWRW